MSGIEPVEHMARISGGIVNWRKLLLIAAVTLVSILYIPDAEQLWSAWLRQEEFSHGPLMFLVALYLLWRRRVLLDYPDRRGTILGVGAILLAVFVYALSIKAGIQNTRHLGFLLLIFGLFLTFGGVTYARFVFPSLILLPFVVPPPSFLNSNLSYGLQLFSSDLSVSWLRWVGVTVFQDGNIIDLGTLRLQVAEACSGLRYLYPMVGLGVLTAMLFDIPLWKRGLFVGIAAGVAIIMNSVRIFLTGLFVEITDMGISEGFFHLFEGWVFFLFSFVVTLGLCWITLKRSERKSLGRGVMSVPEPTGREPAPMALVPVTVALILCILFLPLATYLRHLEPSIPARASFNSFPLKINGMIAEEDLLPGVEQEILQLSDYFLGHYRTGEGPPITLFAGYYEQQSAGKTPHSPRVCIPSGGWKIEDLQTISLPRGDTTVPINRVLIGKGDQKLLVYYWFQQRGTFIANEYMAKFNLLWGGLTSSRTDGALIRLSLPLRSEQEIPEAEKRLAGFTQEVFRILPAYVPD
ncbi:VPLPA-CTERM-specific exosortase XrtD [Sneathiella chinensis]|uniref:Methanolan biosynthesis EpsI domain-containing protein n=1 Tax=Sneathiella chinensis TaxID=349750 RepID=A0ABQ5U815_9PROT|nr:VPLPA-CTERM-specific exosortase XrtD [Sneathiella chinensis]GLQ07936.1 hypothetical protein GCM10007924_31580 [Sneathiella chinensis]